MSNTICKKYNFELSDKDFANGLIKLYLNGLSRLDAQILIENIKKRFVEFEFKGIETLDVETAKVLMRSNGPLSFPDLKTISLDLAKEFIKKKKPGLILINKNVEFETEDAYREVLRSIHSLQVLLI